MIWRFEQALLGGARSLDLAILKSNPLLHVRIIVNMLPCYFISLVQLKIAFLILASVQSSHAGITKTKIEEVIMKWFRYAKDRNGGREKRYRNQ